MSVYLNSVYLEQKNISKYLYLQINCRLGLLLKRSKLGNMEVNLITNVKAVTLLHIDLW